MLNAMAKKSLDKDNKYEEIQNILKNEDIKDYGDEKFNNYIKDYGDEKFNNFLKFYDEDKSKIIDETELEVMFKGIYKNIMNNEAKEEYNRFKERYKERLFDDEYHDLYYSKNNDVQEKNEISAAKGTEYGVQGYTRDQAYKALHAYIKSMCKDFEPNTKYDAFQDMNSTFNLGIPWQWFQQDKRKNYYTTEEDAENVNINVACCVPCCRLPHCLSKDSEGTISKKEEVDCDYSEFDYCFLWKVELLENWSNDSKDEVKFPSDNDTAEVEKNCLPCRRKKKKKEKKDLKKDLNDCRKFLKKAGFRVHLRKYGKNTIMLVGLANDRTKLEAKLKAEREGKETEEQFKTYFENAPPLIDEVTTKTVDNSAPKKLVHKGPEYRTKRLMFEAHRSQYTMPLNSTIVEDSCHRSRPRALKLTGVDKTQSEEKWASFAAKYFQVEDFTIGKLTARHPWEPFELQKPKADDEKEKQIWEKICGQKETDEFPKIFREIDEKRLIWSMLNDKTEDEYYYVRYFSQSREELTALAIFHGGAGAAKIQQCISSGAILKFFPTSYSKDGKDAEANKALKGWIFPRHSIYSLQGICWAVGFVVLLGLGFYDSLWPLFFYSSLSYSLYYRIFSNVMQGDYYCSRFVPKKLCEKVKKVNKDFFTVKTSYKRLADFRNFYGEKLALYFAFLNHLAIALLILSIFIALAEWVQLRFNVSKEMTPIPLSSKDSINQTDVPKDQVGYQQYFTNPSIYFYALFVSLWSTLTINIWKGTQARLTFEWNTDSWSHEEKARQEFNDDYDQRQKSLEKTMYSGITGEDMSQNRDMDHRYMDPREAALDNDNRWKRCCSGFFSFITIVATLVVGVSVISCTEGIISEHQSHNGAMDLVYDQVHIYLAGFLQSVQIAMCGWVLGKVAKLLNDMEGHRTDTQYEEALLVKTFAFEFANNFGGFMYVAYVKEFYSFAGDKGCPGGCINFVGVQVKAVFISNMVLGNLLEITTPLCKAISNFFLENNGCGTIKETIAKCSCKPFCKKIKEGSVEFSKKTVIEQALDLKTEYTKDERASDYIEIIILYVYVSMFSIMEPILFPLAFLYIVIESFVDAEKMKNVYFRPVPQKAQSIGATEGIFTFVGWASAFSNVYIATIVARTRFAEPFFLKYGYGGRFCVFVIAEHILIMLKYCASLWFGAIPLSVRVQHERQRFIQNNVIEHVLRENMYDFKIYKKNQIEKEIEEILKKEIGGDSTGKGISGRDESAKSNAGESQRGRPRSGRHSRGRSSSRSRKKSIIRFPSISLFSKNSEEEHKKSNAKKSNGKS